jgi:hypothetical protein
MGFLIAESINFSILDFKIGLEGLIAVGLVLNGPKDLDIFKKLSAIFIQRFSAPARKPAFMVFSISHKFDMISKN